MTTTQIKSIKMGTILVWSLTGEKFRVTGFNEFKIKDGSETRVTGIECDSDGRYCQESMPSVYSLVNSEM